MAAVLGALLLSACDLSTSSAGEAADLRGTWEYTGNQTSPSLELRGDMVIASQSGENIEGSLAWEEIQPGGGVSVRAGAVFGRAIGFTDVDFDISTDLVERRHVARIVADTMVGVWVDGVGGASGAFRAVRTSR